MDTKWKKSKAALGFVSFAIGTSLLLTALLPTVGCLASESGRNRLENALKSDFHETSTFRSYLSEMMNRFLAMGAGGPIDGSYYEEYEYSDIYSEAVTETIVIVQDGSYDLYRDDSLPVQPTESARERWKKEAEAYHQSIQNDKNILYMIQKGDDILYTNLDSSHYDHANRPEGHNFTLSFYNGKCIVANNGVEIHIYGENNNEPYIDDGEHWALPGYTNFPAGDSTKDVAVYIAVADDPVIYRTPDYTSNWSQWQYNRFYYLERNWRDIRRELVVYGAIRLGVGLLFLAVWFFLRRNKIQADQALARFTGHIWFEVKLILLLGAVFFLFLPLSEDMRYLLQEAAYAVSIEDGGYLQYPWFLSQYLYEVTRRPESVLVAFWTLYLFVNDLRYGDKIWRHGIYGMLTAQSLKLPIQKRLSRRSGVLAAALLLLGGYILLYIPGLHLGFSVGLKFLLPPALALLIGLALAIGPRQRQFWSDIGLLTDQITGIRKGELTSLYSLPEDSDLRRASEELADIQAGMEKAVAEQTRSQRMKVELVTNVSHDLKTPLTSIISYVELLKKEQLEPPAGEYVEILSQKAERLRTIVLDVFEISKAASGELPVKLEPLDLAKLLRQTTADMAESITAAPITLRQVLPEEPVTIIADGDRLYRVFQNLLQNALKYALEGSRVYLTLAIKAGTAEVSIKNTSKTELPEGVNFTERFVRGDESRTDGGSGLGLAIADSFTRACGGELRVEPVADLFVVTVRFPLSEPETTTEEI